MSYVHDWRPTKPTAHSDFKCEKCGSDAIEFREWESSCGGFEDYHYRCTYCKYEWWTEGADA